MKHCRKMALLISRRLDEPLDETTNAMINRHIVQCPSCKLLDSRMHNLRQVLKVAQPPAQEGNKDYSLKSIQQAEQKSKHTTIKFPLYQKRFAWAALLIMGIGGGMILSRFLSDYNSADHTASASYMIEEGTSDTLFFESEEPFDLLSYYESIEPESPVILQYSFFSTTPLSSFNFDFE